jgi:hypothetical protein
LSPTQRGQQSEEPSHRSCPVVVVVSCPVVVVVPCPVVVVVSCPVVVVVSCPVVVVVSCRVLSCPVVSCPVVVVPPIPLVTELRVRSLTYNVRCGVTGSERAPANSIFPMVDLFVREKTNYFLQFQLEAKQKHHAYIGGRDRTRRPKSGAWIFHTLTIPIVDDMVS